MSGLHGPTMPKRAWYTSQVRLGLEAITSRPIPILLYQVPRSPKAAEAGCKWEPAAAVADAVALVLPLADGAERLPWHPVWIRTLRACLQQVGVRVRLLAAGRAVRAQPQALRRKRQVARARLAVQVDVVARVRHRLTNNRAFH